MPNVLVAFRDLPVDWQTFGIGAVLLLLPLPLLFGRSVHYREIDRPWAKYVGPALTLPWHWIDLVRSFAGMWLLRAAIGLSWAATDVPVAKRAYAILAVVACVAIIVQTIACKFPDSFHAPFAAVIGMVTALFPPIVSALVLVVGILIVLAFRSAVAFFGAVSLAIVVGYPFFPKWPALAAGAAATILPLLLPAMFHRELVMGHRRISDA